MLLNRSAELVCVNVRRSDCWCDGVEWFAGCGDVLCEGVCFFAEGGAGGASGSGEAVSEEWSAGSHGGAGECAAAGGLEESVEGVGSGSGGVGVGVA